MIEDFELIRAKTADTPREKLSVAKEREIEESPMLDRQGQKLFRSAAMRATYLSQDCVDITEAVNCLFRAMAGPREGHLAQVKRLARYLKGRSKAVIKYFRLDRKSAHIQVHTDSD